jgi:hypothetical protein
LPIDGLSIGGLQIDGLVIVDWETHPPNLHSAIRRSPICTLQSVDRQSAIGNRQ